MKKLLLLLPMMMFLFASCGDDDEETSIPFTKSTLVGTWEILSASNDNWRYFAEGAEMTFNSDGTCATGHSMENAYTIENGVVKTYCSDNDEPMFIYTIQSILDDVYTVKVNGTLDESDLSTMIRMQKQ